MKVAVVVKPKKIEIREVNLPEPNDYQVLCKMIYGATCTATDIHIINDEFIHPIEHPTILGHESIGQAIAIGKKVKNFKVGDIITRVGALEDKEKGLKISWGGFAQYGIAEDSWELEKNGLPLSKFPRTNHIVPDGIDIKTAPMIITWRETLSFMKHIGLKQDMDVLIIGSGGTGLSNGMHAINYNCSVTMIGSMDRKDLALSMGHEHYVDYKSENIENALKELKPEGFDLIVDSIGGTNSLNQALKNIKKGGTVSIYGLNDAKGISLNPMGAPEFTYIPCSYSENETHKEVMDFIKLGKLKSEYWYSHDEIFSLDDIALAYKKLSQRSAVKYLIDLS
jgi:D-arabinose 1-dehydrogenase-like Zn-dependent alcohol dehydrogenase